ncbi:transforming growth factor beta activator LRRC33 [Takifugu flavidus]|nr:transforming growth factor beta activator LRRC33 [Takifugu flavidus]
MPASGLAPVLLGFLLTWTPAWSHPQHSQCRLVQRSANCNNGTLTSVPAWLPGNIKELQLNYNRIQTLQDNSFSYPSLISLSLACNHLEKLQSNTFRDSKLIESLNLASNNLYMSYQESSDALKTVPRLRLLDLSENLLDEDMAATLLQNLTSLEYLNLSGNLLMRLDESSFRDLHQLKELDLQRNIMFEIERAFDGTLQLQRLNLAFNSLPCLYDFHLTQLVVLNASYNAIEWFISRQDLNTTFQLETLDLSHNNLFFFPFLPSRSHLRNLYLSHNGIRFYNYLAANATATNLTTTVDFYNVNEHTDNITVQLWDESLHGDVASVETLDLKGNQVDYFPQGFLQKMPALHRLHVRTNCLETLNLTLEQISSSLYELDISNNRLNQLHADEATLSSLGNLTYLNLSLNHLRWWPAAFFSHLPSLRSVDLSFNGVDICLPEEANVSMDTLSTCVDWTDVASLRQLYLRGCDLKVVPSSAFSGIPLTHLEMSDNPGLVVQESMQSLPRTLQHLGLGNTHTRDLDFSSLKSLTFLNISSNAIAHLPPSLVDLDLKVLDLRDNRLSALPSDQANALATKLQMIFLTGNPFNCCQIEWLEAFEPVSLVGRSELECVDHFLWTHRVDRPDLFMCSEEGGESIFWYILLFVPICLSFVGILLIVLQTFRPKMPQDAIKKKWLKPASY